LINTKSNIPNASIIEGKIIIGKKEKIQLIYLDVSNVYLRTDNSDFSSKREYYSICITGSSTSFYVNSRILLAHHVIFKR